MTPMGELSADCLPAGALGDAAAILGLVPDDGDGGPDPAPAAALSAAAVALDALAAGPPPPSPRPCAAAADDYRRAVIDGLRGAGAPVPASAVDIADERPAGLLWFIVRLDAAGAALPTRQDALAQAGSEPLEPAASMLLGSLEQGERTVRVAVRLVDVGTGEVLLARSATAGAGAGLRPVCAQALDGLAPLWRAG